MTTCFDIVAIKTVTKQSEINLSECNYVAAYMYTLLIIVTNIRRFVLAEQINLNSIVYVHSIINVHM